MDIESKLHKVVIHKLERVEELDSGTDESKVAVNEVVQLMDRDIEYRKVAAEAREKAAAREMEQKFKKAQMRDERLNNIARIATDLLINGAKLAFYGGVIVMTFTYEEKGTVGSIFGRKILGMCLPKM